MEFIKWIHTKHIQHEQEFNVQCALCTHSLSFSLCSAIACMSCDSFFSMLCFIVYGKVAFFVSFFSLLFFSLCISIRAMQFFVSIPFFPKCEIWNSNLWFHVHCKKSFIHEHWKYYTNFEWNTKVERWKSYADKIKMCVWKYSGKKRER